MYRKASDIALLFSNQNEIFFISINFQCDCRKIFVVYSYILICFIACYFILFVTHVFTRIAFDYMAMHSVLSNIRFLILYLLFMQVMFHNATVVTNNGKILLYYNWGMGNN